MRSIIQEVLVKQFKLINIPIANERKFIYSIHVCLCISTYFRNVSIKFILLFLYSCINTRIGISISPLDLSYTFSKSTHLVLDLLLKFCISYLQK